MNFSNNINDITLVNSTVQGREDNSAYSYYLNEKCGFVAVFDGCEQMGNKKYSEVSGHSESYIASRVAADVTVKWFKNNSLSFSRHDAEQIGREYYKALRDVKLKIDKDLPAAVGSARSFPTSSTVIGFDCSNEEFGKLEFLYTGNTRGYVIDEGGLCQITRDYSVLDEDKKDGSAIAQKDIQNILSADGEEAVSYRAIKLSYPFVAVAATDGAFAPLQNPMYFEKILLEAIIEAQNLEDFEKKLKFMLNKDAQDDYSVMLVTVGFDSLDDIKAYYTKRLNLLNQRYIEPFEQGNQNTWNDYKKSYYR